MDDWRKGEKWIFGACNNELSHIFLIPSVFRARIQKHGW
jgi:hypothetical protein